MARSPLVIAVSIKRGQPLVNDTGTAQKERSILSSDESDDELASLS